MHFEILVEDQSGKKALEILAPKIIGNEHTFNVHSYKGIGHIPKDLKGKSDPNKRILLDQLPKLLQGYGRTFANYPAEFSAAVILVCDLDDKCLKTFRLELFQILDNCRHKPSTRFCIAIEEGESWLLGDLPAVRKAYPRFKATVLNSYQQDSICGTWERMADAIYPGGAISLLKQGWQAVGKTKSDWAEAICPHMNVEVNCSPSFCYFRGKLQELAGI